MISYFWCIKLKIDGHLIFAAAAARGLQTLPYLLRRAESSPKQIVLTVYSVVRIKILSVLNGRTDTAIKNHWNSTLKRKCSSLSDDLNDDPSAQQPLRRSASLGTGTTLPTSGIFFNASSPSGSDLSDSSLPGNSSSPVYRPLARTASLVPPTLSMDTSSSTSVVDPPTSLSLSLPGSISFDAASQNQSPGSGSGPASNSSVHTPVAVAPPLPPSPAPQRNVTEHGFEKQLFSPEFLEVMQGMIRKEVRNYMSGMEQNGLSMHTEAIRNAVVKRIGISRVE